MNESQRVWAVITKREIERERQQGIEGREGKGEGEQGRERENDKEMERYKRMEGGRQESE